jgi:ParB/RepB/Spo0J family partition protein
MVQTLNGNIRSLDEFLRIVKPYCDKEPVTTATDISITLKPEVIHDSDKYMPLLLMAKQLHASVTIVPPGFRIPLTVAKNNAEKQLLFLSESDLEDGGPQPRLEIRPDDPATVSLFESIKAKGQRQAIQVYPSPVTPNKYRIYKGHRRRMVIFNMLRKDGILAVSESCTELQAFEDAFIIHHERKSLTAYEMGKYLLTLQSKFPDVYPTQESLAKKLGITQQSISLLVTAYREVEAQKPNLPENVTTQVVNLSEHTIRAASKAPEAKKPEIFKAVTEQHLSARETAELVEKVAQEEPPSTEATDEEKTQILYDEADSAENKEKRLLNKLIENTVAHAPKELIDEVIARSNNGEKLTAEKLNPYLTTWFDVAFQTLKKHGLLDEVFEVANKW